MGIAFHILFKKSFLPQGHKNLFCILLKALTFFSLILLELIFTYKLRVHWNFFLYEYPIFPLQFIEKWSFSH